MYLFGDNKVCSGYVNRSHFWLKVLCDGYVIEVPFLNKMALKINNLICDGYVIENLLVSIIVCNGFVIGNCFMANFLCDRHVTARLKILFDGYLTEKKNYE